MLNKKREPRKAWYWVPFTGVILLLAINVSHVIYLKTPKAMYWTPPTFDDLFKAVGLNVAIMFIFLLIGINGLYQYKKQKNRNHDLKK